MNPQFDHEKLSVYQEALKFVIWSDEILNSSKNHKVIKDQLERAAISIPLNIAEGNGKYTPKDRCRFFDIARGSSLECAACIDILSYRKVISENAASEGKVVLLKIVRMLVGLIRTTSDTRVYEESSEYFLRS